MPPLRVISRSNHSHTTAARLVHDRLSYKNGYKTPICGQSCRRGVSFASPCAVQLLVTRIDLGVLVTSAFACNAITEVSNKPHRGSKDISLLAMTAREARARVRAIGAPVGVPGLR
jgi:hypothetical protein